MKKVLVIFSSLLLLAVPAVVPAETMYVNDNVEVPVRGGKGTEFKILAVVKPHRAVEVLKDESDYALVQLDSGVQGWILRRYLTKELPNPAVIANLSAEFKQLTEKHAAMREQYQKLEAQKKALESTAAGLEEKTGTLERQYQELKAASSDVIKLKEQHDRLREENRKHSITIAELQKKSDLLQSYTTLWWYIAGAGTLIIGLVIGMMLQNLRSRRKRAISF